jgi:hypothetical protein
MQDLEKEGCFTLKFTVAISKIFANGEGGVPPAPLDPRLKTVINKLLVKYVRVPR